MAVPDERLHTDTLLEHHYGWFQLFSLKTKIKCTQIIGAQIKVLPTQIFGWLFSPMFLIFQLKTMKPEEYRQVMRNLELHYQDFMRDSQDCQQFGPDDRMQIEGEYNKCVKHFDDLIHSMEKGEEVLFKTPSIHNILFHFKKKNW